MTRRLFAIEWDDELGPMWMNIDNLMACLVAYCPNIDFVTDDITDEISDMRNELGVLKERPFPIHPDLLELPEVRALFKD